MALVFEDFAERPVEPVTYDSLNVNLSLIIYLERFNGVLESLLPKA